VLLLLLLLLGGDEEAEERQTLWANCMSTQSTLTETSSNRTDSVAVGEDGCANICAAVVVPRDECTAGATT